MTDDTSRENILERLFDYGKFVSQHQDNQHAKGF